MQPSLLHSSPTSAAPLGACRIVARPRPTSGKGCDIGGPYMATTISRKTFWRPISTGRFPTSCGAASTRDSAVFRHPGELDLNLREYMVVLEKPVGLTLAPDPRTGQVVVQDIRTNSPADKCGLIQVGDVVRSCSAVFGDDMWAAGDIRRVRWAINSRLGDVRLILERGATRRQQGPATAWYCGGKAGVSTRERDGMQLPYSFNGSPSTDDPGSFLDLPGAGRILQVVFHRNTVTHPPSSRRAAATAAAAHAAALQRLRRELIEARGLPRLDLSSSLHPRPGGPDGFVLPPAPAPPLGGARGSGGGRSAGAASLPASMIGGGGGGNDPGGPPPPPVVDVVAPAPPSTDGDGGSGNGGGGGGGGLFGGLKLPVSGGSNAGSAGAATAAAGGGVKSGPSASAATKERRVVTFLPWLLVACGRLEHRHIAQIASSRSLGALLELALTRSQPPPPPPPPAAAAAAGGTTGGEVDAAGGPSANGTTGTAAGINNTNNSNAGSAGASNSSSSSNSNSSSLNIIISSNGNVSTGSSSSNSSSPPRGMGGYLVVRGSDMMPLASDVGRVSYQALLAAAAAGNGSGTPALPPGEAPPRQPPPGSAAATAAMINGTDVVQSDGTAVAAAAPGFLAAGLPGSPTLLTSSNSSSSSSNSNGKTASNAASTSVDGTAASAPTAAPAAVGLGSSTMDFLNRSIFLNLRPNPAAFGVGKPVPSPPSPSPSSNSSPPPVFSALPTSRYDPARVRHLLNAAASLQRLTFRRAGRLHRPRRGQCAVMLHCDEGLEADVAVMLAGWLHWFGRLPLQEAILAAETAIGATVDQGLLEAGTAALLQGARERCSRVVMTWKYGGLSAYVAGDVVASWGARVPMVRCRSPTGCKGDTHPGHFYLEVRGLRPGVYYYKYIVDGTWAVDSLSAKVLDSAGNWNNVLVVPEPPQVLTSREGLALARWQAGRLAFEAKMGLAGPGSIRPT